MRKALSKISQITVANALRLLIGLWVLDSPFVYLALGDNAAIVWNDFLVGGIVAILAAMRVVFVREAFIFRISHVLLGLWLTLSPWIFGYVDEYAASWNSIVSGIAIAALATWGLMREHHLGDGDVEAAKAAKRHRDEKRSNKTA
jgi:SPW repeat